MTEASFELSVGPEHIHTGKATVTVTDVDTGRRYVEASYEFGRHSTSQPAVSPTMAPATAAAGEPVVLVTRATGGIGQSLLRRLGSAALGVSRGRAEGLLMALDLECLAEAVGYRTLRAIVHCAWPTPDNTRLTGLGDPTGAVEHHVAQPLRQMVRLGQLLAEHGTPDALLVLVGSTSSEPGRHNYRMRLYTSPSRSSHWCAAFSLSSWRDGPRLRGRRLRCGRCGDEQREECSNSAGPRGPGSSGRLPAAEDVADQLAWVIEYRSFLLSGATLTLTGGALP